MVNLPLIGIAYPRRRLHATRADRARSARPASSQSSAPFLDTLSPTPSPALLSPEEAKARLREIVERFFFRQRDAQGQVPARQLLVRSPPGLGKTKEAMEWATRYQTEQTQSPSISRLSRLDITPAGAWQQVAIFVPRHELAREVKEIIERNREALGATVEVPVLRGRDNGADEGQAPCRRWREARELGSKGLPVYSNLCRRRYKGEASECPYYGDCEYIRAWRAAYNAPYVILVHSHLGIGWESTGIVRGAAAFGDDDRPRSEPSFNPADAAIIVCDEDPTASLIEKHWLEKDAVRAIGEQNLGEHILAGLETPGGLLDHLRANGITPEQLRSVAARLRREERRQGKITEPSAGEGVLSEAISSAPPLVRLSRVLERLADELASGRQGPAYSLLADRDRLIAQGRRPWRFRQRRLLVLDGTANAEILKQFVPSLVAAPEIRVRRNARVIQVSNATFYKGSLIKRAPGPDGKATPEPKARLLEVGDFIEKTARKGKTLVVTNRPVRCALTGEDGHGSLPISAPYRGADVAHFGNLRGSNEFERHEIVIILGRDEPAVRDAERRAMAIWHDTKEPIRCIRPDLRGHYNYPNRMRRYVFSDGRIKSGSVSMHPDPRVQAVVEQAREAEMLQATDRLRLIHTEKRKTVYILCSVPLDIQIDELVTWKQLTGDRRLSEALAECDARGWDALPLAAKELARLFLDLWPTKKAAERWIAKNPPKAYRDIIRVWGVLNTYRPPSQTSWSKALVRHGADPQIALTTVLGVAAEDIQVRETAGSEPPSKANTAPQPAPHQ
jgi:hypothetical protein